MPRDLPVTEIMSAPAVTLSPAATIEEAIAVLAEHGFSGAPVVDEDGRLVGLLDDADLIVSEARLHGPTVIEFLGAYLPLPGEHRRWERELRQSLAQTVEEVMRRDPPWLDTSATLEDVATLIVEQDVSRVPIVDEDRKVVGVVSRGDIVRALAR
ncbi:MAG TPA: CBS domain-containing protein [Egibacteraceae bacterium]|mgnify:CR=1 FL=1